MKIKFFTAAIAALLFAFVSTSAQARHRHHYQHHARAHHERVVQSSATQCDNNGRCVSSGFVTVSYEPAQEESFGYGRQAGSRPGGCRHAWCGCGSSLRVFGRIIPELNLAANWRRFPPASCASGNAAWRYGHVFIIESCNSDGTAVAYDPNSGGHVAHIHTVSLVRYHVVNPHGGRYASSS